MKTVTIIFILSILSFQSFGQVSRYDIERTLIEKLIISKQITFNYNSKIVVSTNSTFCQKRNCKLLFRDYKDKVIVMDLEQIFQRIIPQYIIIKGIDYYKKTLEIEQINRPKSPKILTFSL